MSRIVTAGAVWGALLLGVAAGAGAAQPTGPLTVVTPGAPAQSPSHGGEAPAPFLVEVFVQEEGQPKGWLGIGYEAEADSGRGALRVEEVYPGSAAARAGLLKGDTLLRLNGRPATAAALRALRLSVGDTVRVRIRRGGQEMDRALVATALPRDVERLARIDVRRGGPGVIIVGGDTIRIPVDSLRLFADSLHRHLKIFADSMLPNAERLRIHADSLAARTRRGMPTALDFEVGRRAVAGAEFSELNPELAGYFRGAREGVLVLRVAPETPAARAGLRAGDVVVRAGGAPTRTVRELRRLIAADPDRALPLDVVRKGKTQRLTLRWER